MYARAHKVFAAQFRVNLVGFPPDQHRVVKRVEVEVLSFRETAMASDDLGAAGDHHLVDIAAHQNVTMSVGARDGIIIAAITHQRQRTDLGGEPVASILGNGGKLAQPGTVPFEALPDRLVMTAQPVVQASAALVFQPGIKLAEAREPQQRHHEVAAAGPQ